MRRIVVLVSIVAAVLVAMVVLGFRPGAVAQEATPSATVDHPVVGA